MDDHDHGHDEAAEDERVTSPMQDYSMGQVATGFVVLAVGLVATFGVALALA
jgi:hypothetical protein